ncbi:aminotransferase class IV [Maribellus maritimus]|uniref:aminotransferase class IV n=1 Tax=Maribellus maritimus TaxID=2870838 RepID=UPI001EEB1F83|nr:aminotransferase class IV [Maribellus maritimus]MCG6186713.1 aminotransferase class IV [Maribellus maritimus]
MSPLFETIKCKNGKLFHLKWHNARMNSARKEAFHISEEINLSSYIKIPEHCKIGLFRCRVTYSEQIEKIEFLPHRYRKIESLKLIEDNKVDYHLKYANRSALQELFEKRKDCDDILIVSKGYITDSFTANVIFFDGKKWWTPNTPLLKGTQRERLLYKKQIEVCKISPEDLNKYTKVGLINALQDFENMPVIKRKNIKS